MKEFLIPVRNLNSSVTCSLMDAERLQQYRWRYINGRVVTTDTDTDGIEKIRTMGSVIFNLPFNDDVYFQSENNFDYTRENISLSRGEVKRNTYIIQDNMAYMVIQGQTVFVDRDMIPHIQHLRWTIANIKGVSRVVTYYYHNNKRVRKTLARYVLGEEDGSIAHINGDTYDCRRSNLKTVK